MSTDRAHEILAGLPDRFRSAADHPDAIRELADVLQAQLSSNTGPTVTTQATLEQEPGLRTEEKTRKR